MPEPGTVQPVLTIARSDHRVTVVCAYSQDLHDPILDGPGVPCESGKSSVRSTASSTVLSFLGIGSVALLTSCAPVRADLKSLLYGVTMPAAIMSSWIAAGLGSYGFVRYPSLRMTVLAICAIAIALLSVARFWLSVMPG
jgi:hypothetical protein